MALVRSWEWQGEGGMNSDQLGGMEQSKRGAAAQRGEALQGIAMVAGAIASLAGLAAWDWVHIFQLLHLH